MSKIIMTKGLPASGKSTWAKEYQKKHPNTVRVNKDDLRAMLHNGVWSKSNEEQVLFIRDFIIQTNLIEGLDTIVDDTNLSPKHESKMRELVDFHNKVQKDHEFHEKESKLAEFEIKDFTDVPLDTCIERDLKRPHPVGPEVIRDMHKQFLANKQPPSVTIPVIDPNLETVILCDMDGTLADGTGKNMYERDFINDKVIETTVEVIKNMPYNTIILSGRNGKFEAETREWLAKNNIPFEELYMRKEEDKRKDFVVKEEMYNEFIKDKYNVRFVLDDRNQVVDLWRSLGLVCHQVNYGDF